MEQTETPKRVYGFGCWWRYEGRSISNIDFTRERAAVIGQCLEGVTEEGLFKIEDNCDAPFYFHVDEIGAVRLPRKENGTVMTSAEIEATGLVKTIG